MFKNPGLHNPCKIKIPDHVIKPINDAKRSINILFWNIGHLSKIKQALICSIGIFICYLPYGYLQERMFRIEGFKDHSWFISLYQFSIVTCLASLEKSFSGDSDSKNVPKSKLFFLASLTVGTIALSNTAVGYLNYPTQIIFKCCKLIPVMIGCILIQGKKYGTLDFLSMLFLSIGLIFFMLADKKVSPEFNITGVFLISLALIADAMIGNTQEKIMKTYGTSNINMIFYSYGIGFLYILSGCLITGKFFPALNFYMEHPTETFGFGFLFSVCGYVGIQLVLAMIASCGALATVTLTTFRKAISIVLSFLLITKPFTWQYVWSGLIVLIGLFINIYSKNHNQLQEVFHKSLYYFKYFYSGKKSVHGISVSV